MRRVAAALLALLAPVALAAACSPTGSEPSSYFPLVRGATWTYEVRSPMPAMGGLRIDVEARGPAQVLGLEEEVFVMDERTRGGRPSGRADSGPVAYRVHEGYVARYTSLHYDANGRLRLLGRDRPVRMLPERPSEGQSWFDVSTHFASPDGSAGIAVEWRSELRRAAGPVAVPAGRFEDVLEVSSLYVENPGSARESSVRYLDYYARGVGRVRSVVRDPGGDPAKRVEQLLVDYEVPGSP